jgi:lysophospholipase L1-like esterase
MISTWCMQMFGSGSAAIPSYVYNLKTSNTTSARTAIQNAIANVSNTAISFIGHSGIAGQSFQGTNQLALNGPANRTSVKLESVSIPSGANNIIGYHNGYGQAAGGAPGNISSLVAADSRVTATGTMALQGVESSGGLVFGATDATGVMAFTPQTSITEFDIYATQNSGHATYNHSWDNTNLTSVNTSGAAAVNKASVTGLPLATHTIRHGWVSGTTRVIGIEARNGTRKEVSCRNLGISGMQSAGLLTDSQVYTRRSMDKYLAGSIWFIMCLVNDVRASVTVAAWKANVKAKVADAKLVGAVPILALEGRCNDATGQMPNIALYWAAAYEIANEDDIPLIDFAMKWGTFAQANTAGYMSDTLHPSFLGYDNQANTYAAVTRYISSGTYSEVFP